MENNQILSKYLIERGVNEPKHVPNKELVLDNEEILGKIAVMDVVALKALIGARVDENREELVMSAVPEEVFVLRQVMLDLTALLQDQEYYRAEYERRKKKREATPAIEVILPEDSSVSKLSTM